MSQTTLPERVLEWTETYCDSLTENYKQHSVRIKFVSVKSFPVKSGRMMHLIL